MDPERERGRERAPGPALVRARVQERVRAQEREKGRERRAVGEDRRRGGLGLGLFHTNYQGTSKGPRGPKGKTKGMQGGCPITNCHYLRP